LRLRVRTSRDRCKRVNSSRFPFRIAGRIAPKSTNVGINIDQTRIPGFEVAAGLRVMCGIILYSRVNNPDSKVEKSTPPIIFAGTAVSYVGKTPLRVSKLTFNVGAAWTCRFPVALKSTFVRNTGRSVSSRLISEISTSRRIKSWSLCASG
jgi:hypothetical protein